MPKAAIDMAVRTDDVPMTDEQKFIFDLKGWIAIPAVLTEEEIEAVKAHIVALKEEPESLDPIDRYSLSGPAQILLDHPVVMGVLRTILSGDRSEDCYGVRCENSFPVLRSTDYKGLEPHGGGAGVGMFSYNCHNGRIFSGLTRVVWELNPVEEGDGGTLFMSGSHKANFGVHEDHKAMDSPMFETYTCPPGSVVIFSESVCHAGPLWTNVERSRISVFNCYSPGEAQYHKLNLPHEVIEAMPPKRQTLFRGVWTHDFKNGRPNDYFSEDNISL
jgi:hypothetical protein